MIRKDIDLNSKAWCNLVFEGKNRLYGAYYLRKTSTKRHILALIIVVFAFSLLLLASVLFDNIMYIKGSDTIKQVPVSLSELIMYESEFIEHETAPIRKDALEENNERTVVVISDKEDQSTLVDFSATNDSIISAPIPPKPIEIKTNLRQTEKQEELIVLGDSIKPEFLNEYLALLRYCYQQIQYPSAAYKQRIQGCVVYSFILNKDGSITDATLEKGVYSFLDEEVLRVINSMSSWKPIMRAGVPIKVKCYLPVEFKI